MVLDSVGRCWTMLEEVWLCSNFFHPTSSNVFVHVIKIRHNFVPSTEVQHFLITLDSFEHSSIQHWLKIVQLHLTMLDNVWPTCLIRLNGPWEVNNRKCYILTKGDVIGLWPAKQTSLFLPDFTASKCHFLSFLTVSYLRRWFLIRYSFIQMNTMSLLYNFAKNSSDKHSANF